MPAATANKSTIQQTYTHILPLSVHKSKKVSTQQELAKKLPKTQAEIERLEAYVTNVDRFIEKARRFTSISELTPELLRLFISKIIVHEKSEKYSRTAEQKVEIHYAHIGAMENADSPA